ncbi:putative TetR family transcriptional regulator [Gordonia araii NBRC 100433]|uniref:Putative TetR family transcriptional regulator n=1 Tax=Gordonia araii NBRC 100433 TaxID=1073574 RepID=G7H747_9ACTN|nr:TetR/AcrR family transcriptional regulator [Gordonia araii]NNG97668.1 TetR/AcrR family transcriptional regulator [Gordonia araii NBRC 100433]GAB11672.1 putative TetR family transcriptional regulator [Gordonia araii NBRC 100433]
MATDTRERIIESTAELYRRQGMTATGLKQIAAAANAPFGSIYHHFPGGKEQISEEVIRAEGIRYSAMVGPQLAAVDDLVAGIPDLFAAAAAQLESMDYTEACSIETIALEVASTNERLRVATATVFTGWIAELTGWFAQTGLPDTACRRLALGFLTSLEGAFVLCRSLRSTEPMTAAGVAVQAMTRAELERAFS